MKAYYVGVSKCCGHITAALVDDESTKARDIGIFARSVTGTGREFKRIEMADNEPLHMARCKCPAQQHGTEPAK